MCYSTSEYMYVEFRCKIWNLNLITLIAKTASFFTHGKRKLNIHDIIVCTVLTYDLFKKKCYIWVLSKYAAFWKMYHTKKLIITIHRKRKLSAWIIPENAYQFFFTRKYYTKDRNIFYNISCYRIVMEESL